MLCMGCSNGLSWGEAATEGCCTLGEWNVYGMGMCTMIAAPKGWRKDVLEGHLGVSRGTTSSRW